ncbi:MAG: V-type ATP synthase subunit F [Gammaproteobacteria bacterium]|nr:V-type ATP synthase subunit F [Gammaproteobacteria bacterium]
MTPRFSYIGDPLSALGFALIGAQRFSPALTPSAIVQAVEQARDDSDLVLIETPYAGLVDEYLLATIIAEPLPPILIVPCLHEDDDLSQRIIREARIVLGIG